jgi:hypothetical protein
MVCVWCVCVVCVWCVTPIPPLGNTKPYDRLSNIALISRLIIISKKNYYKTTLKGAGLRPAGAEGSGALNDYLERKYKNIVTIDGLIQKRILEFLKIYW